MEHNATSTAISHEVGVVSNFVSWRMDELSSVDDAELRGTLAKFEALQERKNEMVPAHFEKLTRAIAALTFEAGQRELEDQN